MAAMKKKQHFTLTELMVVITIIVILLGIGVRGFRETRSTAISQVETANLKMQVQKAIDAARANATAGVVVVKAKAPGLAQTAMFAGEGGLRGYYSFNNMKKDSVTGVISDPGVDLEDEADDLYRVSWDDLATPLPTDESEVDFGSGFGVGQALAFWADVNGDGTLQRTGGLPTNCGANVVSACNVKQNPDSPVNAAYVEAMIYECYAAQGEDFARVLSVGNVSTDSKLMSITVMQDGRFGVSITRPRVKEDPRDGYDVNSYDELTRAKQRELTRYLVERGGEWLDPYDRDKDVANDPVTFTRSYDGFSTKRWDKVAMYAHNKGVSFFVNDRKMNGVGDDANDGGNPYYMVNAWIYDGRYPRLEKRQVKYISSSMEVDLNQPLVVRDERYPVAGGFIDNVKMYDMGIADFGEGEWISADLRGGFFTMPGIGLKKDGTQLTDYMMLSPSGHLLNDPEMSGEQSWVAYAFATMSGSLDRTYYQSDYTDPVSGDFVDDKRFPISLGPYRENNFKFTVNSYRPGLPEAGYIVLNEGTRGNELVEYKDFDGQKMTVVRRAFARFSEEQRELINIGSSHVSDKAAEENALANAIIEDDVKFYYCVPVIIKKADEL